MATIFCFTSTGNSLNTANLIADTIGATVLPMRGEAPTCEDDVIGYVFPCYFWGIPRIVERFVANMQITNKDAYVFAVYTCGGPVFGVLGSLKKALKEKDIRLRYCARVISVTNYIPEYRAIDSKALQQKIETRTHKIARAIKNRKSRQMTISTPLNRRKYKAYPDETSDRNFSVASACNGCAICRSVCPVDNIAMEAGKPSFQHKCEHCLACLQNCPTNAIDWKDKTQGKERYRNANVSLDALVDFNMKQN